MKHRRADSLSPLERAEIIKNSELAAGLTEDSLTKLAHCSTAIDYRRRRFIYRASEQADALYIIARGLVKLCLFEECGEREAVIDILPAGSLFGESALFHSAEREKCAAAFADSRLLRIPVGVFQEEMEAHRELYHYTFRLVGQRLARAEQRVADFALDAIPLRLDKLLRDLAIRYGQPKEGGVLIDLALPHREIASIVGSTRESVTVRLNHLRRAGIIDFVDRKILIKQQTPTEVPHVLGTTA